MLTKGVFLKGGERLVLKDNSSKSQLSKQSNPNKNILKNKGDSFMSSRKMLSLLVVFALVFTLMAPAFAAAPTDVVGTPYEESVGKLSALGVLAGYPDGTYKPDQNITRAEFAKIATYILGLQSAADLSKGQTNFKDVNASHWASGYVNMAAEKGMIKGYPDGTFKPENNVTYAEAITILVRALGMGPVVEGKGTWPANYLSKASEAGITSDVATIAGNDKAIRGTIAQLAWNTLEAEKWGEKEYTADGVVYGPLGKALLEVQYKDYVYKDADGKFVPKAFEDVEVTGTQLAGGLASNEIKIKKTGLDALLASNEETVEVTAADVDLNSLFGKKVNILFGKDNEVSYIKVNSENVVEGNVTDFNTTDNKIEVNDKEYAFKTDAKIYVNTKDYTFSDANFDAIATAVGDSAAEVTLVLDSGKIAAMNMFVADDITVGAVVMEHFVVKEIKSNGEVKNVAVSPATKFDLDDVTADPEKVVIVKNGKAATKDDIKAGDAVTYIKNGDLYYLVVSDSKVTGTITKISDDENGASSSTRKKITIDGKEYAMTRDNSALMTKTSNVDDVTAIGATISDYYNKEAALSLNAAGEIILVSGSVKGSATMQTGVVAKAIWEGNPDAAGNTDFYIQVLTSAGEKKAYKIKGDDYKDNPTGATLSTYADTTVAANAITAGQVVLYDVSADGTINAENLYEITTRDINDSVEDVYVEYVNTPTTIRIKDATQKITVAGTDYFANSSTVYLNSDTVDSDNPSKIADWDKIVSDDKTADGNDATNLLDNGNFYLVYDENKMIEDVIVNIDTTGTSLLGSTAKYGLFVEKQSQGDDDIITLYVNGQEVQYTVARDVYNQSDDATLFVKKGDLVRFDIDGDGKFDGGANLAARQANFRADISVLADTEANADKVKSINKSDRIVIFEASKTRDGQAGLTSVKLASDVLIYDARSGAMKMGTIDDIVAGQFIIVDDYDATDDVFGIVIVVE